MAKQLADHGRASVLPATGPTSFIASSTVPASHASADSKATIAGIRLWINATEWIGHHGDHD
jgi:hypothetical protein